MSAEATGTDTKLYAGATCVPTADPHVHGGGFAGGTISNFSEVQLPVFCPVVRNVPRGQEIGVEKVTIWVVDLHPDDENDQNVFDPDNVFCTFDSRDNPKVSLDQSVDVATAASEGASPDVQELEILNRRSAPRGYYVLQCNIPAAVEGRASSIIAYEVVERQ